MGFTVELGSLCILFKKDSSMSPSPFSTRSTNISHLTVYKFPDHGCLSFSTYNYHSIICTSFKCLKPCLSIKILQACLCHIKTFINHSRMEQMEQQWKKTWYIICNTEMGGHSVHKTKKAFLFSDENLLSFISCHKFLLKILVCLEACSFVKQLLSFYFLCWKLKDMLNRE